MLRLGQLQSLGRGGARAEDVGVGLGLLVLRDVLLCFQLLVLNGVLTHSFEFGLKVLLHPEGNKPIRLVRSSSCLLRSWQCLRRLPGDTRRLIDCLKDLIETLLLNFIGAHVKLLLGGLVRCSSELYPQVISGDARPVHQVVHHVGVRRRHHI